MEVQSTQLSSLFSGEKQQEDTYIRHQRRREWDSLRYRSVIEIDHRKESNFHQWSFLSSSLVGNQ